ncbi:putative F-box domain-containing protein [Helianthus annuus]|uniref:F-box domain-containing protein n=1 Tax=Helianthus annuus TaxID=4232 RepID=A0A251RWA1_HELAN|nr:putative F-box domain-containing protein [Helianthus annuus]
MADFLHDDIVWNILARLPAKPLLRFRCVSTQWSSVLTEPNFMKFRSRKTIILPQLETLQLIDDNVPIDDTSNSIVSRRYPLENLLRKYQRPQVMGTFNWIVLLTYSRNPILYNPFTCVSNELPCPSSDVHGRGAFGLGYGANSGVLKLVKFRASCQVCHVFDFRECSWSSWRPSKKPLRITLGNAMDHFVNGFLYWILSYRNVLMALNVESMVLSKMYLPFNYPGCLGTMNGCLCVLKRFNIWVMKKRNKWSKIYSFKLPLERPICVLGSGRILMESHSSNLIIYDPKNNLRSELNVSLRDDT